MRIFRPIVATNCPKGQVITNLIIIIFRIFRLVLSVDFLGDQLTVSIFNSLALSSVFYWFFALCEFFSPMSSGSLRIECKRTSEDVVTAGRLRSPGLFFVFSPILTMLWSGWARFFLFSFPPIFFPSL